MSEDAYERLMDWWPKRPLFSANEHGLWCLECGELIAPTRWFEDDEFVPRETCKSCGSDGVEEEQ